jgi:hypothetical protein
MASSDLSSAEMGVKSGVALWQDIYHRGELLYLIPGVFSITLLFERFRIA